MAAVYQQEPRRETHPSRPWCHPMPLSWPSPDLIRGSAPAIPIRKGTTLHSIVIIGTGPAMTTEIARSYHLQLRPGPPVRAHRLPGVREPQHADIVEAAADDLETDGQSRRREARIDGGGRLVRHVQGDRVADMLERFLRIVDGRCQLRRIGDAGRHRRDYEVEPMRGGDSRMPHHHHLVHAAVD